MRRRLPTIALISLLLGTLALQLCAAHDVDDAEGRLFGGVIETIFGGKEKLVAFIREMVKQALKDYLKNMGK